MASVPLRIYSNLVGQGLADGATKKPVSEQTDF
jgi:hypothetical protein